MQCCGTGWRLFTVHLRWPICPSRRLAQPTSAHRAAVAWPADVWVHPFSDIQQGRWHVISAKNTAGVSNTRSIDALNRPACWMVQRLAFSTALQSNWCNCPFSKHRVGDRASAPMQPPHPSLKWGLISIWKWALHIIKLRGDPELDTHEWFGSGLFFFNANVPSLYFFFCQAFLFPIHYTWRCIKITRFLWKGSSKQALMPLWLRSV